MMSKKGASYGVGTIIVLAIGCIVALTLLQATFNDVGTVTNTVNQINQTKTLPASVGGVITLNGQASYNHVVINQSGTVIGSGNYTIDNYFVSNGQLITRLNLSASTFASKSTNISYTYEPFGYDTSSGGRAMLSIVVLLSAVAIVVFMIPSVRENLKDTIGV